jgi:hypothetical protein
MALTMMPLGCRICTFPKFGGDVGTLCMNKNCLPCMSNNYLHVPQTELMHVTKMINNALEDNSDVDILHFLLLLLCLKIQQLFHSFQEVRVRFAGFDAEEDEWVNVIKCLRQCSLPCESFECVVVLPGDLILCFQVLF